MDYQVLKKNFENHRFHTSYFETKEEAILARELAEKQLGFHPNHGKENGEGENEHTL